MDSNFLEIRKAVSELKMRAAFFTSMSILLMGLVLWYVSGKQEMKFFSYMSLAVFVISIVSAIRYTLLCRNLIFNGRISYWKSVNFSLGFFFLSGMILTLGAYAFLHFHPDFFSSFFVQLDQLYEEAAALGQNGMYVTKEELQESRSQFLSWSNFTIAVNLWFPYLFYGFMVSLIYSIFLRGGHNDDEEKLES